MPENSPKESVNKFYVWQPLLMAIVMALGMFFGANLVKSGNLLDDKGTNQLPAAKPGKIEEILRYIDERYVEDVDRAELEDEVVHMILSKLDPHSHYFTQEEFNSESERLNGAFEGVGVEFVVVDDTMRVVTTVSGGPSELSGILPGDQIIMVDEDTIAGKGLLSSEIIDLLRGEKGSEVTLGIRRHREELLKQFVVVRDKIPLNSLDVAYEIRPGTVYTKLNKFSSTTYEEFMEGIDPFVKADTIDHLIIDLRQNAGGYLTEAVRILNQLFAEKDRTLVYTEGRNLKRRDYVTQGNSFFDINRISVLIDEGSASASEIIAGAVQDWDRGQVIGRRSFGKGLVQEQYNLAGGGALRLTVAKYYTPSGRLIQKPYERSEDYQTEITDRYNSGELWSADSIEIIDSTKYYTAAGNVVYGGGGIIPEIYVPFDSLLLDDLYIRLRRVVPDYVFDITDQLPVTEETDITTFHQTFQVDDALFGRFLSFARNKDVTFDPAALSPSIEQRLKTLIKARIARHYFKDLGFFTVWNEQDIAVQKALELVQ